MYGFAMFWTCFFLAITDEIETWGYIWAYIPLSAFVWTRSFSTPNWSGAGDLPIHIFEWV
jgi:hypothetical protein